MEMTKVEESTDSPVFTIDTPATVKQELTPTQMAAMDSKIEKVIDDVHSGRPERNAARPVDPYVLRNHRADILKGRQEDKDGYWKQVMEYHGWNWIEPEDLNRIIGPERYIPSQLQALAAEKLHDRIGRAIYNSSLYWTRPHELGQWRNDIGRRRPHKALQTPMAWTMEALVGDFGEPKAFDEWAKTMIRRWQEGRQRLLDRQRR